MSAREPDTHEERVAQEIAAANEETRVADLRKLMMTREFRRFAWWLLSETDLISVAFNTNFGLMSFKDGKRSVGVKVWSELREHAFAEFQAMEREAREKEVENEAKLQNAAKRDENISE